METYSLDEFGVKKHDLVLQNGLRVIFIEKPFAPIYGKMMIRAGSVFNPSDNGLAHFTEHIMVHGPGNVSKREFQGVLEAVGAFHNAFTSTNWMTVDAEIAEAGHIPMMRDFFAGVLGNIHITEEKLCDEKEIILSELQKHKSQRGYDSRMILRKKLTAGDPWGYSTLGLEEGIRNITVEAVRDFFTTYCVVENMLLVVAGGCSVADIEESFSTINFLHGKQALLFPTPSSPIVSAKFFYEENYPETNISILYKGPVPNSRDSYVLDFAMNSAHRGPNSPFMQKIRNEKALAYHVFNKLLVFNELQYIGTEVGVPATKVDETIDAVFECYQDLLQNIEKQEEIDRRIDSWYLSAKRTRQKSEDWINLFKGKLFPTENPIVGDFPDIYNFRKTITTEEIRDVLQRYINLDNFILTIFGREPSKKYY